MIKILKLFIFIIFVHAIYNLINYLRYSHIEQLLLGNYSCNSNLKIKAQINKNTILNYIKYSGAKDRHIPITESTGYGQIVNGNISVFENILNTRQDIASSAIELLLEAKGNYWSKFINSINPFYWIRFMLFIPKNLLSYLGVNPNSILIKIFQIFYWLLGTIFSLFITIYPNEIKKIIDSIINIF